MSQKPYVLLFNPFDNDSNEFVSKIDKSTSGFELTAEHAILYVVIFETIRLMLSFALIGTLSTKTLKIGVTKIKDKWISFCSKIQFIK